MAPVKLWISPLISWATKYAWPQLLKYEVFANMLMEDTPEFVGFSILLFYTLQYLLSNVRLATSIQMMLFSLREFGPRRTNGTGAIQR